MDIKTYSNKTINKEFLLTTAVMLLCMFFFSFFPAKDIFQNIIVSLVFLVGIPILYIRLILKKGLEDFALSFKFRKQTWKKDILYVPFFLIMFLLVYYLIINFTDFPKEYFLRQSALKNNLALLLFYDFILASFFVALYEFFFRGFVMSYFLNKFGTYAIIIQFIFFAIFLDLSESFNWNFANYIVLAPMSGFIVYKTRSLFYPFLLSLLSIIIADIIFRQILA